MPNPAFLLLLFFLTSIYEKLVLTQSTGDPCVSLKNIKGTCKFIHLCPHVQQLKMSSRPYTRCGGFQDGKEVVCCAERVELPRTEPPNVNRKYVHECENYKSRLFDIDLTFTSLKAGALPVFRTASMCSQNTFPLVVGGVDASAKEFPHMALLGCRSPNQTLIWSCGGSLISTNYVLTAAHCFEGGKCDQIDVVRLGDLDVTTSNDDAKPIDFNVERSIPHPQYNSSLKYNDIALIKLEKHVDMNYYIRPACLPYKPYNDESQLIITGWGSTQLAGKNAAHLQKASVEKFEQSECNDIYVEEESSNLPAGVKDRTQICAGSKQEIKDTCQGDSGGPLQTIHPNHPCMYSIIGITSYGQPCGSFGIPGVYTRVYHYIDWIESIVWD